MMQSGRVAFATSGRISGSGLAKAKTMGFSAIVFSISVVKIPGAEQPRKISAPLTASSRVRSSVSRANSALFGSILGSRSEEHTSELLSRGHLVCRLLLENYNYDT